MAEQASHRYYLEIQVPGGRDMTFQIGEDPVLIGSGAGAALRINAPQVKEEHALLSVAQNRVWIENLSSSGTYLGGRPISKRTLLTPGESFLLGADTRLTLRMAGRTKAANPANIFFPVLLGLIILVGLVVNLALLKRRAVLARPVTQADWSEAFDRIGQHLQGWQRESRLPDDFVAGFAQAWFRERAGDKKGALAQWRILYNAMTALPIKGVTPPGRSIADSVSEDSAILHMFMGRDWEHDPDLERIWRNLDEAYMNALWWFVGQRIEILREDMGN